VKESFRREILSRILLQPGGTTLYFLKDSPAFNFGRFAFHTSDGKWIAPEVAPFSGQYSDADPFKPPQMVSKFFFISNRTAEVWRKSKRGFGHLDDDERRIETGVCRLTWARLSTAMEASGIRPLRRMEHSTFGSDREGAKDTRTFTRSRLLTENIRNRKILANHQYRGGEFEPFIAPDQSFLISCRSGGRPRERGPLSKLSNEKAMDRTGKPWKTKLIQSVRSIRPKIPPNGKYFFWSSTRTTVRDSQDKRLSSMN